MRLWSPGPDAAVRCVSAKKQRGYLVMAMRVLKGFRDVANSDFLILHRRGEDESIRMQL